MTTDINALTGPALSAAVAQEVMGWHEEIQNLHVTVALLVDASGTYRFHKHAFRPDNDIEQAREVIAEIQRRGLINQLLESLRLLWAEHYCGYAFWEYLLTCPPSDICRAALRVVREQINNELDQQFREEGQDA